jgi:tripartite-type tricarboxylate transporter receptor subunit TctC
MLLRRKSGTDHVFRDTSKTPCVPVLVPILLAMPLVAAAQTYPAKPVRFVVPYPAGGINDIIARLIANRMAAGLGSPWIVDNRAGRGGIIGSDLVAKSPPDGYTLVHGGMGSFTLAPFLSKVSYESLRDFTPITLTARAPNLVVVHPSLPVRTVKELIALSKSRPGQLDYATPGVGSTPHLTASLFVSVTAVRMVHIPYKGSAPATTDLVAGQVPIGFMPIATVAPHLASGRLRALGVTSLQRSPSLPSVPTMSEAGLVGFEMNPWFGVLAPAATPAEIIAKLNTELVRVLRSPEIVQQLAPHGVDVVHSSPEEFVAVIRGDLQKWGKVIREAGIKGE